MRRRGTSPWLIAERNRPIERMLPCVAERIAQGEHPLEVWAQQQSVPLRTLARRSKIDMSRLLDIVHGAPMAGDETELLAKELRIVPGLLASVAQELER